MSIVHGGVGETGFLDRVTESGVEYVVYVPRGVELEGIPVILFLHGSGESGEDGLRQTAIGLGHSIRLDRGRWPFLVVFPQKPDSKRLWPAEVEKLDDVLRAVEAEFQPDPHRRYITGLSQGGHGTLMLASSLAWQFAAAAAVCGWTSDVFRSKADQRAMERVKDIPFWLFHGDEDPVVPVEASNEAGRAIRRFGGDARVTVYEGVGHNSWDKAYAEADLPGWFLKHTLGEKPEQVRDEEGSEDYEGEDDFEGEEDFEEEVFEGDVSAYLEGEPEGQGGG